MAYTNAQLDAWTAALQASLNAQHEEPEENDDRIFNLFDQGHSPEEAAAKLITQREERRRGSRP